MVTHISNTPVDRVKQSGSYLTKGFFFLHGITQIGHQGSKHAQKCYSFKQAAIDTIKLTAKHVRVHLDIIEKKIN